jgi:hypothetical protein
MVWCTMQRLVTYLTQNLPPGSMVLASPGDTTFRVRFLIPTSELSAIKLQMDICSSHTEDEALYPYVLKMVRRAASFHAPAMAMSIQQ